MSNKIPDVECLDEYSMTLAQIVAKTSWLPDQSVVQAINRAVFPTKRDNSNLYKTFNNNQGKTVGMYDDNVTPEWAIFWAHDLKGTRPKGWTIAHVWPISDDVNAYTHLANLLMVPEPFASLTDKKGPLTGFLRWHAWYVYKWKPEREAKPDKPKGYDEIEWRYLKEVNDPNALIKHEVYRRNSERIRVLRPIMERQKML